MRSPFGRNMAVGVVVVVLFVGTWYWMSRPRALDMITADYYERSVRLAAELESADDERALEILAELATFGGMAEPAVPAIVACIERLETPTGWTSRIPYEAASRIGDSRFIPVFLRKLDDENTGRRDMLAIWELLGEFEAVEVIEPMLRVVSEMMGEDISVYAHIAMLRIARRHPDAFFDAVVHSDPAVRKGAIEATGGIRFEPEVARSLSDKAFALLENPEHPAKIQLEAFVVNLAKSLEDERVDQEIRSRVHVEAIVAGRVKFERNKDEQAIRDEVVNGALRPSLVADIEAAAAIAGDDATSIRFYLSDESHAIRSEAVRALSEHAGRDVVIRELRAQLNHSDIYHVQDCVRRLAELKAVEAVDDLLAMAQKKPPRNLADAMAALVQIDDERAIPLFLEMPNNPYLVVLAAEGLAALSGATYQSELEELVLPASRVKPRDKVSILLLLEEIGGRSRERELLRIIETADAQELQFVRHAMYSWFERGDRKRLLLKMLRNRNDQIAQLAVQPLVGLMGEDALPYLVAVIPTAGLNTINQIVLQLRRMDSDEAVDALIRIMERHNSTGFTLREITGENYGDIAEAWRAWYRERH